MPAFRFSLLLSLFVTRHRCKNALSVLVTQRSVAVVRIPGMFPAVHKTSWPVPVAVLSKALVFDRSRAGIVGSNPGGGMNVCLL